MKNLFFLIIFLAFSCKQEKVSEYRSNNTSGTPSSENAKESPSDNGEGTVAKSIEPSSASSNINSVEKEAAIQSDGNEKKELAIDKVSIPEKIIDSKINFVSSESPISEESSEDGLLIFSSLSKQIIYKKNEVIEINNAKSKTLTEPAFFGSPNQVFYKIPTFDSATEKLNIWFLADLSDNPVDKNSKLIFLYEGFKYFIPNDTSNLFSNTDFKNLEILYTLDNVIWLKDGNKILNIYLAGKNLVTIPIEIGPTERITFLSKNSFGTITDGDIIKIYKTDNSKFSLVEQKIELDSPLKLNTFYENSYGMILNIDENMYLINNKNNLIEKLTMDRPIAFNLDSPIQIVDDIAYFKSKEKMTKIELKDNLDEGDINKEKEVPSDILEISEISCGACHLKTNNDKSYNSGTSFYWGYISHWKQFVLNNPNPIPYILNDMCQRFTSKSLCLVDNLENRNKITNFINDISEGKY